MTTETPKYPGLGFLISECLRELWPNVRSDAKVAEGLSLILWPDNPEAKGVARTTVLRWKAGSAKPDAQHMRALLDYFEDSPAFETVEGGREALEQALLFLTEDAATLETWHARESVPALARPALQRFFPKPEAERAGAQLTYTDYNVGRTGMRDVAVEDGSGIHFDKVTGDDMVFQNVRVGSWRKKDDEE
ncbi:MAG: hypothetical protein AAF565_05855 [Pseudomonadota bacterium]